MDWKTFLFSWQISRILAIIRQTKFLHFIECQKDITVWCQICRNLYLLINKMTFVAGLAQKLKCSEYDHHTKPNKKISKIHAGC